MATTPRRARFIAGGPEDDDTPPPPSGPTLRAYPCKAHQCPAVGAIFLGSTTEHGVCSHHYGQNAEDWPRITQCLLDWACVMNEINHARRVFVHPETCTDVKAQNASFRDSWARMEPLVGAWAEQLRPDPEKTYSQWIGKLEPFMAARVLDVLRGRA